MNDCNENFIFLIYLILFSDFVFFIINRDVILLFLLFIRVLCYFYNFDRIR